MLTTSSLDPYFRIGLISQTPDPQQTIYAALHQDYSEGFVFDEMGGDRWPTEQRAGEIALRRILRGELHAGPLEHPQIVLNVGGFPHSVMQQARTHRIASFDVQCVAGDTAIRLEDGEITIAKLEELPANIQRSLVLISYDEVSGHLVQNRLDTVVKSGIKPVYKVVIENARSLFCTAEHRILTVSGGWRTVGEILDSDDEVAVRTDSGSSGRVVSITPAGSEQTYDILMLAPHHNFIANGVVVHNSMRYTGDRIVRCAEGQLPVEEVFYLRPVGDYTDRKGHKYHYDAEWRASDLSYCLASAKHYARAIARGAAEEHARGTLAFDFRQNFIVSMNMRSLGHLLTIRGKLDAQLEIQEMCKLMLPHYEAWAPEIYGWFIDKQWRRGRLSL